MGAALRVAVVGRRSADTGAAVALAELVGAELCRSGHTVLVSFGYGAAAAALRAAADQAACGYGPPPAAFAAHHNGRVLVGGLWLYAGLTHVTALQRARRAWGMLTREDEREPLSARRPPAEPGRPA